MQGIITLKTSKELFLNDRNKPLSAIKGIGHAEFDGEGRVVATEYEGFWLVNAYVPNSGAELGRLSERTSGWDPAFGAFCKVCVAVAQ